MGNLFSVPIFFVLFRESLEAAIIISVLIAMSEQIVKRSSPAVLDAPKEQDVKSSDTAATNNPTLTEGVPLFVPDQQAHSQTQKQLLKKLRLQILFGGLAGLVVALAMSVTLTIVIRRTKNACRGAAFIAIYYTQVKNLWSASEEIWEGVFSLIAYARICRCSGLRLIFE